MALVEDGTTIAAADLMRFHEVVQAPDGRRYIRSMRGLVPIDESIASREEEDEPGAETAAAAVPTSGNTGAATSQAAALAALQSALVQEEEPAKEEKKKKKKGLGKVLGRMLGLRKKVVDAVHGAWGGKGPVASVMDSSGMPACAQKTKGQGEPGADSVDGQSDMHSDGSSVHSLAVAGNGSNGASGHVGMETEVPPVWLLS
jgi:hypothetical protein